MRKRLLTFSLLLSSVLVYGAGLDDLDSPGSGEQPEWIYWAVFFLAGCIFTLAIQVLTGNKVGRTRPRSSGRSRKGEEDPVMVFPSMGERDKMVRSSVRPEQKQPEQKQPEPSPVSPKQESGHVAEEPAPVIELSVTNHLPPVQPEVKKGPKVLYFPNPGSGGVFRQMGGRERFLDGASIYMFTITDEDRAEFEFCSERSSVAIALNNRNELIMSVAEELNPYNPHATKLLSAHSEKGAAKLEGNYWVVTKKAKIKYV